LARACDEGRAVLIVDGLDEVGDVAVRVELRDRLLAFLDLHPRVPVNRALVCAAVSGAIGILFVADRVDQDLSHATGQRWCRRGYRRRGHDGTEQDRGGVQEGAWPRSSCRLHSAYWSMNTDATSELRYVRTLLRFNCLGEIMPGLISSGLGATREALPDAGLISGVVGPWGHTISRAIEGECMRLLQQFVASRRVRLAHLPRALPAVAMRLESPDAARMPMMDAMTAGAPPFEVLVEQALGQADVAVGEIAASVVRHLLRPSSGHVRYEGIPEGGSEWMDWLRLATTHALSPMLVASRDPTLAIRLWDGLFSEGWLKEWSFVAVRLYLQLLTSASALDRAIGEPRRAITRPGEKFVPASTMGLIAWLMGEPFDDDVYDHFVERCEALASDAIERARHVQTASDTLGDYWDGLFACLGDLTWISRGELLLRRFGPLTLGGRLARLRGWFRGAEEIRADVVGHLAMPGWTLVVHLVEQLHGHGHERDALRDVLLHQRGRIALPQFYMRAVQGLLNEEGGGTDRFAERLRERYLALQRQDITAVESLLGLDEALAKPQASRLPGDLTGALDWLRRFAVVVRGAPKPIIIELDPLGDGVDAFLETGEPISLRAEVRAIESNAPDVMGRIRAIMVGVRPRLESCARVCEHIVVHNRAAAAEVHVGEFLIGLPWMKCLVRITFTVGKIDEVQTLLDWADPHAVLPVAFKQMLGNLVAGMLLEHGKRGSPDLLEALQPNRVVIPTPPADQTGPSS